MAKCIRCPKEAETLLLAVGRFGSKQPHVGTWVGMWLCAECSKMLGEKMAEMGIRPDIFVESGLPKLKDEFELKELKASDARG